MLTFVVDNLAKRYDNLYPRYHDGYPLTEPNWLLQWLDHYSINYNIVSVKDATPGSWYCVGVNFWNFGHDYLENLPESIKEKISHNNARILFIYREADSPVQIRRHIVDLCQKHGFSPESIWLISGNSQADQTPNSRFFWYFDCNYLFQTQNSPRVFINSNHRPRNVTCLSRIHKHWREWFVYNLCRFANQDKNYISYGAVKNHDPNDFVLWHENNRNVNNQKIDIIEPDRAWRESLPLKIDDLDTDQHNQHDLVIPEHFQNSYWNIVLETLLDTDVKNGVFITEKTLKPIRNGQSFVILGCQHSLAFLQDRGYKTFDNVIDESYDDIESLHDRWYAVFEIARELATMDHENLARLQNNSRNVIQHNLEYFQRSRRNDLLSLTAYLDSV